MKVILLKDIKGVGKIHQIVEVKDGYAKNYLIKNRLAVVNTISAQQTLKQDLSVLAQQEAVNVKLANELKNKLEQIQLEFTLKVNQGNVFGSISHKMILDELHNKYQIKIDKFMIDSHNEKTFSLGKHTLTINIYKQIVAKLPINIRGLDHG
ncbi:MAG: 50S ribosomal protein L9 [Mycoplasmataceae bacterium]|jgi:large subunit ribosomal protein L9|nr:50S ribosomal protein L9 [Mycoplasmataceae bacterium]